MSDQLGSSPRNKRGVDDKGLDFGLLQLCQAHPDHALTQREIADKCNCAQSTVHAIERQALAKMRRRLKKLGVSPEECFSLFKAIFESGEGDFESESHESLV